MQNLSLLKKTIIATLSWMVLYPKNLFNASILPALLMLPFIASLWNLVINFSQTNNEIYLPEVSFSLLFYLLMASVGYALLSINVYRLVILGADKVSKFGSMSPKKLLKFIMTLSLVQIILTIPVLITGTLAVYLLVYPLVVPMVMNLPRLALDLETTTYQFNIQSRIFLTILQAFIPLMVIMILGLLLPTNAFSTGVLLVIKLLLNYWELIVIALNYQNIEMFQSKKRPN